VNGFLFFPILVCEKIIFPGVSILIQMAIININGEYKMRKNKPIRRLMSEESMIKL
jgi:hypothetical protein